MILTVTMNDQEPRGTNDIDQPLFQDELEMGLNLNMSGYQRQDSQIIMGGDLNMIQRLQQGMNGRALTPGNSISEKNLLFNQIRYVKPIFFVKEDAKETRNLYYDSNPYFLNNQLHNSRAKGIYNTSRNSNVSKDLSQTSSQRSSKVVRANGLRLAEKPRILKGVVPERQTSLSQARNNQQTRKLFDRNIQLSQQNRLLKVENNRLRENMRIQDQFHKKEVEALNKKFQALLKKTEQLQMEYDEDEKEWKKKIQESSQIKTNSYSQFSSNIDMNSGGNTTPKQYYFPSVAMQKNVQNNHRK